MLTEATSHQSELEYISIEELVPADHLLRKIAKAIDFRFIYEKVAHLYCRDNGRPSVDPVVLFKMLMIGYLFGIRSERQLVKDIEVNVAYRWFLGFGLRAKIPDHSVFSQNRRRRFADGAVFAAIFEEIVRQAMAHGLVDGRTLYTDSTHLKASANQNRFERKAVSESTRSYLEELDAAVAADRRAHGKAPLGPREEEPKAKPVRVSTTDPDSGFMARPDKPRGFYYLDHRTVDGKHNLITDAHVTPGNVHDSQPYLDRLDHQRTRFGFVVEAVGLDAGYYTPAICKGLSERGIYAAMPYTRPGGRKGALKKTDFVYDEHYDCYLCPQDRVLAYATTTRDGYRIYRSQPAHCRHCPLLARCTQSKDHVKTVQRHLWEAHKETVADHRYEPRGNVLYARRKQTVERSFADAKQLHGHRYARYRGLAKVQAQCLLAATCQNMKKIALILCRRSKDRPGTGPSACGHAAHALRHALQATIALLTEKPTRPQHYAWTA